MHRSGTISVLLAVLLLASCAKPAAKPETAALLPPPPPPPPPARPALHAAWSFHSQPNACLARAAAGRTRLEIAVRRDAPIRLTITLPGGGAGKPVARFHGPAGAWTVAGFHAGSRAIVFDLGHDMNSLSRVLVLLSGGVLDLHAPDDDLPVVTLAPSGGDGQQWFACARDNVI